MTTPAEAVHEIVEVLASAGLDLWIGGGWDVDALLGRQPRNHADLDVAVVDDLAALRAARLV